MGRGALEHLDELRLALSAQDAGAIHEEIGDLLFTCVNLARHLGLDAEESLRSSTGKFERRFQAMEAMATTEGEELSSLGEQRYDQFWRRAKAKLAGR